MTRTAISARKAPAVWVLAVCAIAWLVCQPASAPALGEPPAAAGGDAPAVAKSSNEFALALYKQLASQDKGNLFYSPDSIHAALSMTYAGAAGQTATQMAKAISLPGLDLPEARYHKGYAKVLEELTPAQTAGYQLYVANALWAQEGYEFLPQFLTVCQEDYGAGVRRVNFKTATEQARKAINAWVEKQTKDKIKDLLAPGILTDLTRLVLTNAIYFKGDWAVQFDKKRTRPMPFQPGGGESVDVPMMYQEQKFGYMETPEFQMLEMPYKGDELSMVVLLPRKVDALAEAVDSLKPEQLQSRLASIGRRKVKVQTYLPRFKLTSQFRLDQTLRSMGMEDAFTREADFSRMNGRKDLYIQAVVHKAFVDVNEEGTEAAAATAVVVGIKSAMPHVIVFKADHPFLFLIRHNKTGVILFMGRLAKPA